VGEPAKNSGVVDGLGIMFVMNRRNTGSPDDSLEPAFAVRQRTPVGKFRSDEREKDPFR
jgi:hypothetical protein